MTSATYVDVYTAYAYLVIYFQTSKRRVLKTDIHPHYMVDQSVWLVGLQWRGDGQSSLTVTVEDVH